MRKFVATLAAAVMAVGAAAAQADENAELVIDGQKLATRVAAPAGHPLDEIRSGWTYRSVETQALQLDDFENPGMIYAEEGFALWSEVSGAENKSCASCHNDISSMAGLRAAMPKWNAEAGKPWTMEMHVNNCLTTRMGAEAWGWDSREMLGMTVAIGLQSRGMSVAPDASAGMEPWVAQGREIYYAKSGQLDMSCANCHEDNADNMIRADHLSQGQINGFPTYRLKWQGVGSLHRRFKGCMENVRAEAYKVGSDEFIALEAYVATRGVGLSVETPAVRQ